jgi:hypothetical protein
MFKIQRSTNEVKLVDRDEVSFLAGCEAKGIKLANCPAYIREWIERETTPRVDFTTRFVGSCSSRFCFMQVFRLGAFSRGESRFRHLTKGSPVYSSLSLSNSIATSQTLLISPTSRELPDINPSGTTVANNYFLHTTTPAQP